MNLRFNKFYSPDDALGMGGNDSNDELETFELLNVEDEPEVLELPKPSKVDDKNEESSDKEDDEEVDELEELEKELKPPSEEDLLEITTPVRRKEILAKYPQLFKDFPYLEKAYYREQQYTELLPTVADAKLAVEKAQILDKTEQMVMNGDISSVLIAARDEDREAFHKIADNYLSTLRRVDESAYFHVLGNVVKDTIITMVREGRALGEQGAPLQAAANVLNQFVFGSQTFAPPTQLARKVDPDVQGREQELQQQKQNQLFERFDGVRSELQTKADNVLKSTIDGHIDPNGSMSDYVKQHATTEAFKTLGELIGQDARFRSLLDKLWEKAFQSNFDKTDTDRIKAAYLSKAKTLLPSVIKTARTKALKGSSRAASRSDDVIDLPTQRGPVTPGRSASPSSGHKGKDIPKGMSSLDFLMKD